MNEVQREEKFREWLKKYKNLSDSTCVNYSNRLKNKIPQKLKAINFRENENSLYTLSLQELEQINLLFINNQYGLQEWNRTPTIGSEALNSLKYLIEYLKSNNINTHKQSIIKNDNKRQPLNQILYGPPGTGKTYNTINKALEIIDGVAPDDRAEAKAKFEEYKKMGLIEFITFHQSYGYEEFVEGIKADTKDGEISYDIESGIFKKISFNALISNVLLTRDSMKTLSYDEIYEGLLEKINKKEIISLELKTKDLIYIVDITKNGNINFKHNGKTKKYLVSKERLKKLFDFFDTREKFISISNINDEFRDVIGGCNSSAYWAVLNYIHQNNIEEEFEEIDIENMSTKEQEEIVKKYLETKNKERSNKSELKNYILIIDEINRGNISKIFGELITLIEPSKRIGADEEIRVKLPYSSDQFGVPQNLYILGTMNTADRSIALMDTALRRRFDFTEMLPNLEVLGGIMVESIDIKSLLEKINKRIEYLYDRDHTIGHAYFMSLKDNPTLEELNNIMRNKIIPLLQEYFYDDWKKILLVLNDGFIQKESFEVKKLFESIDDDYQDDEKVKYSICSDFIEESYIKIYGKIES